MVKEFRTKCETMMMPKSETKHEARNIIIEKQIHVSQ